MILNNIYISNISNLNHSFRNIFKDCLTNRLLAIELIVAYRIRVYHCEFSIQVVFSI